jgi:hypothetical protein
MERGCVCGAPAAARPHIEEARIVSVRYGACAVAAAGHLDTAAVRSTGSWKGGKTRYIPDARAVRLMEEYLDAAGHRSDAGGALFRPLALNLKNRTKCLGAGSVYRNIV